MNKAFSSQQESKKWNKPNTVNTVNSNQPHLHFPSAQTKSSLVGLTNQIITTALHPASSQTVFNPISTSLLQSPFWFYIILLLSQRVWSEFKMPWENNYPDLQLITWVKRAHFPSLQPGTPPPSSPQRERYVKCTSYGHSRPTLMCCRFFMKAPWRVKQHLDC